MIQQVKFAITTDGSGAYTSTVATAPQGEVSRDGLGPWLLYAVEWVDGALADGVDAVLSVTNTLSGVDLTLLTLTDANSDLMYYPRVIADGVTGADLTGWYVQHVVDGTLKLTVTSGGSAATGACIVYLNREE